MHKKDTSKRTRGSHWQGSDSSVPVLCPRSPLPTPQGHICSTGSWGHLPSLLEVLIVVEGITIVVLGGNEIYFDYPKDGENNVDYDNMIEHIQVCP
jgi:hypothetical protein